VAVARAEDLDIASRALRPHALSRTHGARLQGCKVVTRTSPTRWLQTQGSGGLCPASRRPVLWCSKVTGKTKSRCCGQGAAAFALSVRRRYERGSCRRHHAGTPPPLRRVLSVRDGLSSVPAPRLGAGRLSLRAAAAWSRPSVRFIGCAVRSLGCLLVCLCVCLFVWLFVCLFVCLFACLLA
jgi:hypothetical protein